jgi:hypothetical protein
MCSWQIGQGERVQERVVALEGAGPVSTFEKSDSADLILVGTKSGRVYIKRSSFEIEPFFDIDRRIGCPVSFAFLPLSS